MVAGPTTCYSNRQTHPEFCLPESDPTTFTGVLDAYISAID